MLFRISEDVLHMESTVSRNGENGLCFDYFADRHLIVRCNSKREEMAVVHLTVSPSYVDEKYAERHSNNRTQISINIMMKKRKKFSGSWARFIEESAGCITLFRGMYVIVILLHSLYIRYVLVDHVEIKYAKSY